MTADTPATRRATRLGFVVAGFGIACWAPLVPFAKHRLAVDDGMLGLLLLCIGIGSVVAMLLAGPLSARFGSRPVILAGGFGLAAVLPALTLATTPVTLAVALLAFGAALGSLDVAINVHAVEVERAAGVPLMSGFHALFSIGGFVGAALMTASLSLGVDPRIGTLAAATIMAVAIAAASARLLRTRGGAGPLFVAPRGPVLLLAALAAVIFLAEGAMLDWGALLLTDAGHVAAGQAGMGYMSFAVAMTAGRLVGDRVTARIGDRNVLRWGGAIAVAGFALLLAAPVAILALAGFVLIGAGASNIVPVLFRRAGSQTAMPAAPAIAAITTTGYAGILLGPAGIGVVARLSSLPTAFWIVAALVGIIPLTAHVVAGRTRRGRRTTGPTG